MIDSFYQQCKYRTTVDPKSSVRKDATIEMYIKEYEDTPFTVLCLMLSLMQYLIIYSLQVTYLFPIALTYLFFHKASKSRQVSRHTRYTHNCTFCRGIAPGLIVRRKNAHVTSSNKFFRNIIQKFQFYLFIFPFGFLK